MVQYAVEVERSSTYSFCQPGCCSNHRRAPSRFILISIHASFLYHATGLRAATSVHPTRGKGVGPRRSRHPRARVTLPAYCSGGYKSLHLFGLGFIHLAQLIQSCSILRSELGVCLGFRHEGTDWMHIKYLLGSDGIFTVFCKSLSNSWAVW